MEMVLVFKFVQGSKVLHQWGIISVSIDAKLSFVFKGLCSGDLDSADGWHLPEKYVNPPVTCMFGKSQTANFQSPSTKVQEAIELGKYLNSLLQSPPPREVCVTQGASVLLMRSTKQLMWSAKYEFLRKNR